ncbi:spore germination protein [Lysinibacillus sp. BW-2-10]|uniref:spore germination protein n=1 Tax=Lysinibacillus sp. BW-2-10 TaxID=2590030 RepID=UPI002106171E|nr:spore germination protein [Lysinibacillus sp. BW-2-10]
MKKSKLKWLINQISEPEEKEIVQDNATAQEDLKKKKGIDPNLESTIDMIKSIYSIPENNDVKLRNLKIGGLERKATLVYISTITDIPIIEEHIIRPLVQNEMDSKDIENIISAPSVATVQVIEDVLTSINNGDTVLFVDDFDRAYVISTSSFEGRGIEKAENEVVVKGPKEAFNEKALSNISLIRKRIKNENLIVESLTISQRSKNELYILYVKDLANEDILHRIKDKVNNLKVDSIRDLSLLEEYIEDNAKSIFPTILYTERPDRATSFLEDGFIILLMDNSPSSLILPATFWSFFHNPEDYYLRFLFGNFIRILRLIALFITLFISSIYIAVTNYHIGMIPADLLLAISATREIVPFPAIVEVLMMEIAFELIREAGLRVPNPIGPTIGIVGALILGQAAVQANIVSPLVVIIVALGGLSSFAIGDINMSFAIRLLRFLFIVSAALFGFYGTTFLLIIGLFHMVTIKSFGVPYLAPMTPKYKSSKDTFFRRMLKSEVYRPGYIKPKDMQKKQENKDG